MKLGDLRFPPAIWQNDLRIIANYMITHTRFTKNFSWWNFQKNYYFCDPFYTSSLSSRTERKREGKREKK